MHRDFRLIAVDPVAFDEVAQRRRDLAFKLFERSGLDRQSVHVIARAMRKFADKPLPVHGPPRRVLFVERSKNMCAGFVPQAHACSCMVLRGCALSPAVWLRKNVCFQKGLTGAAGEN